MTTRTIPQCQVEIYNEITNTRQTLRLPESIDEAMDNCVAVKRAVYHAESLDTLERFGPMETGDDTECALGVVIQKKPGRILIRWWASGDRQTALDKFRAIEHGRALL